jgi:hypothetical protein
MRLGFQSAMALLSYGSCGLALAGCGSRTGLEATGTLQSTSLAADGGSRGPGAVGSSAPVLCAVRAGPVATCAPTPETGTILACNSNFPSCVLPPGATYWECCNGQPRYDGPGGNCGGGSECPVVADKVHLGGASPSSETTFDCLTTPLSVPGTIVPNCTVVAGRFPAGTGTPAQTAACAECSETGLSVPRFSVTEVSSELADDACVCIVDAVASCPVGDAGERVSWCYGPSPGGSSCSGPWLRFDGPAGFTADLYVQCFP